MYHGHEYRQPAVKLHKMIERPRRAWLGRFNATDGIRILVHDQQKELGKRFSAALRATEGGGGSEGWKDLTASIEEYLEIMTKRKHGRRQYA